MNEYMVSLGYIFCDDKVLMLHRTKKENDNSKGKWVAIGGKLECEESPDEALIREVKEETMLDVLDYELKGIITYPKFINGKTTYMYIYKVTKFSGELSVSNEGDLEWIKLSQIDDLNLWEGDKLVFEWINNKFFTAKIEYQNNMMQLLSLKVDK